jgi:hypothetical protein
MKDLIEKEKSDLRLKLDELAELLKKIGSIFKQIESDKTVYILDPKYIGTLLSLSNKLESFESLEGKEGEVFVFFLKDLDDVIKEMCSLPGWQKKYNEDDLSIIMSVMRNIEQSIKDLAKIVSSIDIANKGVEYETFGGLLQKIIDTMEEKRYVINHQLNK